MTELVVSILALLVTGAGAFFMGRRKGKAAIERAAHREYLQRKKDIEDALNLSGDPAAQREWLKSRASR